VNQLLLGGDKMISNLMQEIASIIVQSQKLRDFCITEQLQSIKVQIGFNPEERINTRDLPLIYIFSGNTEYHPLTDEYSTVIRLGFVLSDSDIVKVFLDPDIKKDENYFINKSFLQIENIREIIEEELWNARDIFKGKFTIETIFDNPIFFDRFNFLIEITVNKRFYSEFYYHR